MSAADTRQSLPMCEVTVDHEDDDSVSLAFADELARDDTDELSDMADTRSLVSVSALSVVTETGLSVVSDVLTSSTAATITPPVSRSCPLKSDVNSVPASVAGPEQDTLAESTFESQTVLSASVDQLTTASSCSVVEPSSNSFDVASSMPSAVTVVKSTTVSSKTCESVQTTQTARGKVMTTSTSKMSSVRPLAKKGLTHLLNSSSALFQRKRQLQRDSGTKSVSVGYSGSSVSLGNTQTEPVTLSDSSVSSAETGNELQSNIDANIVPVICDDDMFLMVKDDFCQKPAELSTVDKTDDLSSSLSCVDSCISSNMSSLPSSEVLTTTDKDDKMTSDRVSLASHQVSC